MADFPIVTQIKISVSLDHLHARPSHDDTIYGGLGHDSLHGQVGDDLLYGEARDDKLFGGLGNDGPHGGEGNDSLAGGFGADSLYGNEGADQISGAAGSDLILGGAGDDWINAGFGHDRLNGGAGADTFYHLGVADHGSDWIQDYDAAEGDALAVAIAGASRSQSKINRALPPSAGAADLAEAVVIYRPTGQVLFARVDGAAQDEINLQIGGRI